MNLKPVWGFIIVALLLAIPLFGHMNHMPIQLWDESRQATNALEMLYSNNWFVTTFDFKPDMWNTKPPLLIWLQALSLWTFGYNEIAIRLPSALAAFATCVILYFFFVRKFQKPWLGLISVLVLITSEGYIRLHGTRTGDYDSLLTLCMTAYALSFFVYLDEGRKRWIYLSFLFITLGVLNKAIAALLFLPGLAIYTILQGKLMSVLRNASFYKGLVCLLVVAIGYYLTREYYNPGYIDAVKENELGGRFGKVIEQHKGDDMFYINWLINKGFSNWYLAVLPGVILSFFVKDKRIKKLLHLSAILIVTHLFIISSAATKANWYDIPCYPFLSVLASVFIFSLFLHISAFQGSEQFLNINVIPLLLLCLLFFKPYMNILDKVTNPPPEEEQGTYVAMAYFLKDALHGNRSIDGYTVIQDGIDANVKWYSKAFMFENRPISLAQIADLSGTETVVVYQPEADSIIASRFNMQKVDEFKNVSVYKLSKRKP